ncbi:MAG TPA: hypothetical protein VNH38_05975 [Candidatus Dormibacteraeota bacterium]|nr:hypothetical protein [Candidatus Dormibacteraeota bacterium]
MRSEPPKGADVVSTMYAPVFRWPQTDLLNWRVWYTLVARSAVLFDYVLVFHVEHRGTAFSGW